MRLSSVQMRAGAEDDVVRFDDRVAERNAPTLPGQAPGPDPLFPLVIEARRFTVARRPETEQDIGHLIGALSPTGAFKKMEAVDLRRAPDKIEPHRQVDVAQQRHDRQSDTFADMTHAAGLSLRLPGTDDVSPRIADHATCERPVQIKGEIADPQERLGCFHGLTDRPERVMGG